MADTGQAALPSPESCVSDILKSGFLHDIVLVCGDGKELKAHRFVLYCNSAYFRTALKGNWKETSTCRFDLSEDSSIIQAMLGWVYNKKFSEDEVDTDKSPEFLQLLINVCLAADYYGVPGLQSYAEARFRDAAKEWNKMDEALPDVVRLIYANYDVPIIQTIKKEILDLTLEHLKVLESSHIYQTLFSDVGGFTRDLLFMSQAEKLLESRKTSKQYCSSCGETMMINFESSGYYHCAFCGTYSYFYAPSH